MVVDVVMAVGVRQADGPESIDRGGDGTHEEGAASAQEQWSRSGCEHIPRRSTDGRDGGGDGGAPDETGGRVAVRAGDADLDVTGVVCAQAFDDAARAECCRTALGTERLAARR